MRLRWRLVIAVMAFGLAVPAAAMAQNSIWATCAWGDQTQICDSTVWYPSALTVVWYASPTPDSTSGCGLEVNYHYNSDQITPVACSATWPGPRSGSTTISEPYTLHVETSSPTATATVSRPPDSNGWYNHPVTAALSDSSFSGIAYCSPGTYSGPSTTSATVSGTCYDNAGKWVTATSAPFLYDATRPSLAASAYPGDRTVSLNWQTGGDIAPIVLVRVVRSTVGDRAVTVYHGTGSGYQDNHVRNGARYRYTITAWDQAGNAATQTLVVTPGARLLGPINGVHLASPPLLSWTPIRGATYYNVQLYRNGSAKVLSAWPVHASLQLRHKWRFDGRRYKLKPGRYQWYVWPGFGKRRAARYGQRIGSGTFVMVR